VAKDSKDIGRLLGLTSRLYRARIGEKLAAVGLFPGQEQVLEALASEGVMTMGELAQKLSVRPPTVSKTIARLSAQGLVERNADSGDGRMVQVKLTEAGHLRLAALGGLIAEVEAEMLSDFDGKDKKRLRKLLRRASRALASAGGRALTEPETDPAEAEGDDEG
jgi:DNA-binding MarR family transcriptional regulator